MKTRLRMVTVAIAVLLSLTGAMGIRAEPASSPNELTAETLRSFCSSKDANLHKLCSIYILGVAQGIGIGAGATQSGKPMCIRDDLTESELVDAFMRFSGALKIAYPSDMQAPAVSIVSATVAKAFPCAAAPAKPKH